MRRLLAENSNPAPDPIPIPSPSPNPHCVRRLLAEQRAAFDAELAAGRDAMVELAELKRRLAAADEETASLRKELKCGGPKAAADAPAPAPDKSPRKVTLPLLLPLPLPLPLPLSLTLARTRSSKLRP